MAHSEYDIKEAIDLYNEDEKMKIEKDKVAEERRKNDIAEDANQIAQEYTNELSRLADAQEEGNTIAKATGVTNAVQNHNRNKYLKNMRR